ncbi:MAG: KH domain-containing protein [Nanoarchaeota archaeon]|nr:KH domain-containing protein [Nanoarchaeota archaeon]
MTVIITDKIVRIIKNRKKLEKVLKVKITNKGQEVTFEGSPEDEYEATRVLSALDLGFSFSDAISIKQKELEFGIINIKDFARRGNLEKIRGRIIGKDGKVLAALSQLTNCSLEIKNNEIGIIGNPEEVKPAIDSIVHIIQGGKHANVYKGLEKRDEEPLVDLGLKGKNK